MSERRKMQGFDWFNAAAIVAIGVFLGLAIDGMVDLVGTPFWPLIIIIPVIFGCWYVFYLFLERVSDWLFTGRFFVTKQKINKRKPLTLLFSLPIGIVIGVVGAQFGLGDMLL